MAFSFSDSESSFTNLGQKRPPTPLRSHGLEIGNDSDDDSSALRKFFRTNLGVHELVQISKLQLKTVIDQISINLTAVVVQKNQHASDYDLQISRLRVIAMLSTLFVYLKLHSANLPPGIDYDISCGLDLAKELQAFLECYALQSMDSNMEIDDAFLRKKPSSLRKLTNRMSSKPKTHSTSDDKKLKEFIHLEERIRIKHFYLGDGHFPHPPELLARLHTEHSKRVNGGEDELQEEQRQLLKDSGYVLLSRKDDSEPVYEQPTQDGPRPPPPPQHTKLTEEELAKNRQERELIQQENWTDIQKISQMQTELNTLSKSLSNTQAISHSHSNPQLNNLSKYGSDGATRSTTTTKSTAQHLQKQFNSHNNPADVQSKMKNRPNSQSTIQSSSIAGSSDFYFENLTRNRPLPGSPSPIPDIIEPGNENVYKLNKLKTRSLGTNPFAIDSSSSLESIKSLDVSFQYSSNNPFINKKGGKDDIPNQQSDISNKFKSESNINDRFSHV